MMLDGGRHLGVDWLHLQAPAMSWSSALEGAELLNGRAQARH